MFPFTTPLKMFAAFEEEKLYGVEPPEIVILELCPAKIEIELWLSDIPAPVLTLLTVAVNVAQVPAYAQMLIVDVPVLALPIRVTMFPLIFG